MIFHRRMLGTVVIWTVGLMLTGLMLGGGPAGCGSSGGGDDEEDDDTDDTGENGDLGETQAVTITGVTTSSDFQTTGRFRVGFTATDADGSPILSDADALIIASASGWLRTKWDAEDNDKVSCLITAPTSTDCTLDGDVESSEPTGGEGNAAAGVIIDDSGSMSGNDPDDDGADAFESPERLVASELFIDTLCDDATNFFGLFDFGACGNDDLIDSTPCSGSFTETRAIQDFSECTPANITAGQTALRESVEATGGTPLYTSLNEVCEGMADNATLSGKGLSILLLSDGEPTDESFDDTEDCECTTDDDCPDGLDPDSFATIDGTCNSSGRCEGNIRCDALTCVVENSITTCTVGLGPGSELSDFPSAGAVNALKEISEEGACVYAAATSAEALQEIFEAIGAAVSTGQNFADFAVDPIPASGTTVTGSVTVGDATATFTFVAP